MPLLVSVKDTSYLLPLRQWVENYYTSSLLRGGAELMDYIVATCIYITLYIGIL